MTKREIDKLDLRMKYFNQSFSVMDQANKNRLSKDTVNWRKTTFKSYFNKHI